MALAISLVLTALAAVVVVLTRVRLTRAGDSGSVVISQAVLNAHTAVGSLALVVWLVYLAADTPWLGLLGLLTWWVTAVLGLLILSRWLPSGGKRAAPTEGDEWTEGPGLSMLAHLGMVVGSIVWTVQFAKGWV